MASPAKGISAIEMRRFIPACLENVPSVFIVPRVGDRQLSTVG
jgi:hypothetical protein